MLTTYRKLFQLFDRRERVQAILLVLLILALGLLEVAGVASILPLLAVLADPAIVEENAHLRRVNEALGFDDTQSFLIFLASAAVALVILAQVFRAVTTYLTTRFSRAREFDLSLRLLAGYLHQPYDWFLTRHSADLGAAVLSEVGVVVGGVLIPALRLLVQATVTLVLVLTLFLVDPLVAGATVLVIGLSYWLIARLARIYLSRLGQDRHRATSEAYRVMQEAFGGIKDVKLLGIEQGYLERFREPAARMARREAAFAFVSELPRHALEAVVFGGMVVLLLVLTIAADGRLGAVLPTIGLFAFAGARLFPAVQQIYAAAASMRFNRAALDALHEDLRMHATLPTGEATPIEAGPPRDRIELSGVAFSYPEGARPSLHGLDMTIPVNSTVGIVGPSGAGKTTAVDVLLGLLQPQQGALMIDGAPVTPATLRGWQRQIGYVPQDIFLTDDTLAANIALGIRPGEINIAAVERAGRVAGLHEFVTSDLPEGYLTTLGERGVRLSGGQRQRVGIARALYRNPPVLVLDEATSALDTATERAVMRAVRDLAHSKTIVIIAHRPTTVEICDTIFVIEDGRCVRSGPVGEVLPELAAGLSAVQ